MQARLQVGDLADDRLALRLLLGDRGGQVLLVAGELGAALLRGLRRLLELQELELDLVAATLLRGERLGLEVPGLLRRLLRRLGRLERRPGRSGGFARRGKLRLELLELRLAREHAVQLAVGPEQRDALRRDEVPGRRDERLPSASAPRSASACASESRQRTPWSASASRRETSGRLIRTFASSASPVAAGPCRAGAGT